MKDALDAIQMVTRREITLSQAEDRLIDSRGYSRLCARTDLRAAAREILGRVVELGCACCGGMTQGRQWWNQDDGYGVCRTCVEWMRSRGTSEDEIRDYYGIEGIHWGVEE